MNSSSERGGIFPDKTAENAFAECVVMERLTVLFLAWILMSGNIFVHAAEPCRTRNLDYGQKAAGWTHVPLSKFKKDTEYTLTWADAPAVLRGAAVSSASLYVTRFQPAMEVPARITWKWKTDALVSGADNRDKEREDAPLRVLIGFDGDHAALPDIEKKRFRRAKMLSGRDLPYAVLMYIWSEQVPVDTVIPSAHTGQIKMLVAAAGSEGLGQWQTIRRNLAEDYRKAFGVDPGPVTGVAVMTDTDNTRTSAVGEYADIVMECPERGAN